MFEESESAIRVNTVALKGFVRIADEGKLPMLSYLLEMALIEVKAQEGTSVPTPYLMSIDFGYRQN